MRLYVRSLLDNCESLFCQAQLSSLKPQLKLSLVLLFPPLVLFFQDPELLLIGPGDGSTQSEVINLSTFSSTNCRIPTVPNIDGDWHSYVATMTPDGPLFCGGNTGQYSSDVTNCRLLIKTGVWVDVPPSMEMRGPRAGAAAVHFDNGWWVTGRLTKN